VLPAGAAGRRGAGRRNRWRHIPVAGNARVAPAARRDPLRCRSWPSYGRARLRSMRTRRPAVIWGSRARLGAAMWQGLTSKPRAPSRPGHDQRAVKARAALPRMRAGEPRASMRACSYHASPGPGQGSVLWIGLWIIYVNTLVNRSTAVDEGCCGKVDNRCDTGSCQVAGLPRSIGRYKVSTGEPAGRLIPCGGRARSSHAGVSIHAPPTYPWP
jgi:hypothetical protein